MNKQYEANGSGLSRRDFLKTAAAGAVGAAAVSALGACATTPAAGVSGGGPLTAGLVDGKWSFEIAPAPIPEASIKETITHEVVVVGSGMAGLCTAVAAAEEGTDVIVVSAGTMPISRGGSNQAIGTKKQRSLGINYGPQDALDHVKIEQLAGIYAMDKIKWSRWLQNSGRSMDWMIDKMAAQGLNCNLEPEYTDPDGTLHAPASVHNFWNDQTPLGWGVLFGAPQCAAAYAATLTGDFHREIHYRKRAVRLIRDNNNTGRVSAVIVEDLDNPGSYIRYAATKAVVLATGDFSKDRDMMAKYSPWIYEYFKNTLAFDTPVNYDAGMDYTGLVDGMGQKMGLWVGAAWQRVFPNPCAVNAPGLGPSHAVIDNFWGINLNVNGKRFQNENTNFAFTAMSFLTQPQQTAFALWDSNYAYTQDEWEQIGCSYGDETPNKPISPEQMIANWDNQYVKADTIEGVLDQLEGINKAEALKTIERYNKYADQGYDEEFQVNPKILFPIRKPPFYGNKLARSGITFLCVMGGLRTDEHLQVCQGDDSPIPGLYNTGTMIGDFFAGTYNFGLPGQNLGACCCTLSWILGKELAGRTDLVA
jgi:succinate dehydrogenase/fumarate reductase flavoprotein subunit